MNAFHAAIASMPTTGWIALGVVALPFAIVLGAIAIKILWGFWPVPLSLALGGGATWRLGLEWIWLFAIAVGLALVGTWLWQRSRLFLAGDRALERIMLIRD